MEFTDLPDEIKSIIVSKVKGSPEQFRNIASAARQLRDLQQTKQSYIEAYGNDIRKAVNEINYTAVDYIVNTYYKNKVPKFTLTLVLSMIERGEYNENLFKIAKLLIDNNADIDEITTYLSKYRRIENVYYIYKLIKYAQSNLKYKIYNLDDVMVNSIKMGSIDFYKMIFENVLLQLKAGLFELNKTIINKNIKRLNKILVEAESDRQLYNLIANIIDILEVIENNIF
jgi:hypothetical protein